ncbi:MAG: right-handed parallel beta-helix repeat-containing protein [Opitutaceae bacterium]|nr:right-handed parallel beta-helix repeat-containing protein [Opitutaceae bacterium]
MAAPTITRQPVADTLVPGQIGAFSVVATGTAPLSYQWFKNDVLLTTAIGATTATVYLPDAVAADNGAMIKVRVTDSTGTTESAAARLTVSPLASRDELPIPDPSTARYHLDAVIGNDATGDGSVARPYKTVAKVRPLLRGGEVVLLHNGTYDALSIDATVGGNLAAPYTDWVTFMAAPGATPVVAKVNFHGYWGGPETWNGNLDLRVRVIGLTIADGVGIASVNLVRLENCVINRVGPTTGSVAAMSRNGVAIRRARSVTIQDCEITQVAVGIVMRGNDLTIRRCHIHHNSLDGMNPTGCDTVLIEGNRIHDLDDGIDDGVADWGAHVDGIQCFMETDGHPFDANRHLIIRANRIYHIESMGLMLQNRNDAQYPTNPNVYISEDWLLENNVFGPTSGFMIHGKFYCKGFVFRHNSVVYVENDQFQVQERVVTPTHYDVSLPTYALSTGVEIYNNIFPGLDRAWSTIEGAYAVRYDHNLFYHAVPNVPQPKGQDPIITTLVPYSNPAAFDAVLLADCPGINAGSTLNSSIADLYGTPRDSQPDIGAYEFVPSESYAAWAAAAGLTGDQALATADPDDDGLANILEYGFRTGPLVPSAMQAPTLALDGATNSLVLTHRRSKTANLVWAYEVSSDLATWAPTALASAVTNLDVDGDGKVELVHALLPLSAGDTRRFVRLAVRAP